MRHLNLSSIRPILKLVALILLFCANHKMTAQSVPKQIEVELRYPKPIGDHFLAKGFGSGYTPVIDLGLGYSIARLRKQKVGFGLKANLAYLILPETKVQAFIFSPKIVIDGRFGWKNSKLKVIPEIGLGYSLLTFNKSNIGGRGDGLHPGDEIEMEGPMFRSGFKFLWKKDRKIHLFYSLYYEFIKITNSGFDMLDVPYNTSLHMFYPGVGAVWNFN